MIKPPKKIPRFSSEAAERKFWQTHDTTGYFDAAKSETVTLANLRPSTETISLRLPKHLLERIKAAAHSRDVPYQSLIKIWLSEKVAAPEGKS
jgi:predicted DNA binding CopG/RHH family protein